MFSHGGDTIRSSASLSSDRHKKHLRARVQAKKAAGKNGQRPPGILLNEPQCPQLRCISNVERALILVESKNRFRTAEQH
jgi:hypothetical protein